MSPALPPPVPYRGEFGAGRAAGLRGLALPPCPMPGRLGLRPLKAWRYVGVFGPELMLCAATVRVGRARQSFWAIWDRSSRRLRLRTALGSGGLSLAPGAVRIAGAGVALELALDETAGIETVCPSGSAYAWTRKQGGILARGRLELGAGPARPVLARAVIDDTAAYYQRHTRWRWCAGVGLSTEGRRLAWNLVDGVNDPPRHSERTLWVDGIAQELAPVAIAPQLPGAGGLRFRAEAIRARNENLLVVRSRYRQPFGTFSGEVAGHALAEGWGVMEDHDAWW